MSGVPPLGAALTEDAWAKASGRRRATWWERYNAYLASPAWAEKRRRVFKRARGVCEGCGEARATQVHHLTYRRVFNELLFDLVAVCGPCHQRAHPHKELRGDD